MGSPVPYSSLATVNVPQISLIAHLEFPDTYICVYIHVYTHEDYHRIVLYDNIFPFSSSTPLLYKLL